MYPDSILEEDRAEIGSQYFELDLMKKEDEGWYTTTIYIGTPGQKFTNMAFSSEIEDILVGRMDCKGCGIGGDYNPTKSSTYSGGD
jgi:hypothetical protein